MTRYTHKQVQSALDRVWAEKSYRRRFYVSTIDAIGAERLEIPAGCYVTEVCEDPNRFDGFGHYLEVSRTHEYGPFTHEYAVMLSRALNRKHRRHDGAAIDCSVMIKFLSSHETNQATAESTLHCLIY